MTTVKVGVIGGSGLYEMEGLANVREVVESTPYGAPSDALICGELGGVPMVFLPRHGRGHVLTPSEINYRANIHALKKQGVTHVISVSACGSLREEIEPGRIVLIDQFFDRTKGRAATFFGDGVVAHVAFADPVCRDLRALLLDAGRGLGIPVHDGGTYVCMEGPAFSTRSESVFYRQIGADVIGMTNLTEAKLAREAELSYATLALATDYDCWREHDADVDIQDILRVMSQNVTNAKAIIRAAVPRITMQIGTACFDALKFAIITDRAKISAKRKDELRVIAGRYLDQS